MHRVTASSLLGLIFLLSSSCDLGWIHLTIDGDDGGLMGPEAASGSASTTTPAQVTTPRGASLSVPEGAIPAQADGGAGKVTFSIEVDNAAALPPLPTGTTRVSDIYRFGPSSTNFLTNVAATVPLTEAAGGRDLSLYRVDETTKTLTLIGRDYDPAKNTVTGQTPHFSLGFVAAGPQQDSASGCTVIDNSSAPLYHSKNLVISQVVSLKFPTSDANGVRAGDMASLSSESCSSGICSKGKWYLPQGTYQVCVEEWARGTQLELPKCLGHWMLDPLVVDKAWHHPETCEGHSTPSALPVSSNGGAALTPGVCPTRPPPTASIGTGALQISLRWSSAKAIDLDLHVTDAAGAVLNYRNTSTPSGGTLDVDNKCDAYENGRPENGFWGAPPPGQYKLEVDWYGDCGSGLTSTGYEVRVVNQGAVRTYTGTIASTSSGSAKVLVDTITVK